MTNQIETKQAYQEKVKAQLDKLNAQYEEMKAKAAQAKADASIEYHSQMEELSTKIDAGYAKLQEIQQASDDAWSDLKAGFEKAWNELDSAFQSAFAKFQ